MSESQKPRRVAYFAGAAEGPIKIGSTCGPDRRLRELRPKTQSDLQMLAINPNGIFAEMRYHARFAAHRLHGEWFERSPDILAEITRLSQGQAS